MRTATASALVALALLVVTIDFGKAEAATPTGLDVSWPQCGKRLPTPLAFAVVGIDNGKAYTTNPCFKEQYEWAGSTGVLPQIYMTLRSPQGPTAVRGLDGPAGRCLPDAILCVAHNYGYNAAVAAFAEAERLASPPAGTMWWLDIETMSHWSPDQTANARVIQGAIDFLQQRGVLFGVYSTRAQWHTITGGYALPPGLPIWIAGAHDHNDAPTMCVPRHTFGGGQLWMVQYIANNLDHNHVCGEPMSVTILTRGITSASATSSAALRSQPEPAAAPTPPPAVEAATLPPAPPKAAELAYAEGRALPPVLPAATQAPVQPEECAAAIGFGAVKLGFARVALEADNPRPGVGTRRRRPLEHAPGGPRG